MIEQHIAAEYLSTRKSKFGEGANLKNDLRIIDKNDSTSH